MKLNLILVLVLAFIVSCSKEKKPSLSKLPATISEQQIDAVMANQIFECASIDGGPCPAGIARLLIINKENERESALCSGFMVSSDTLVTNQHCIPSLEACKNTHVAIFNGEGYEQSRCKSVVKILNDYPDSNDPRKKLDVTIVKLKDPYFGRVFHPSSTPVSVNDPVTIWVVDHTGQDRPIPNLFESRITEFKCKVAIPTPMHQALMLDDCPVIAGNSGSPAFNASGDVIGIIWGSTSSERIRSNYDLESRRRLPEHSAATDISLFKAFLER